MPPASHRFADDGHIPNHPHLPLLVHAGALGPGTADRAAAFEVMTQAAFQARHGIRVVAISVDGGPMPGFPYARRDNGIATTLKVTQVPAVYLAQPFTGKITPIGFGVLSEAQLVERIAIVAAAPAESATSLLARQSGPP